MDLDSLNLERLRIGRNELIELLKRENIGRSIHFIPLHLYPYYRDTFGYRPDDFPNASSTFERIVSLPIFPKMTEADIQRVIDTVTRLVKAADDKLDELPQLLNAVRGEMSFVGPRPEVRPYVERFREDYAEILRVRPAIPDLASLKYRHEAEFLGRSENPE